MNSALLERTDLCAIVVSYHPDAEFSVRIAAIANQVNTVIIVDNSTGTSALPYLPDLSGSEGVRVIANNDNLGIAEALNIGIAEAVAAGYLWVLLFDQDTSVNADMAQVVMDVYAAHPARDRLAVIGSNFHDSNRPVREAASLSPQPSALWQSVEWVITSGSLLNLMLFKKIGPFRSDFFIDFVDVEYCQRARKQGYEIIRTSAPLMIHTVGAHTCHQVLGMQKWTSNHSANRRYYITRNYTAMLRESGNYRPGWWAIKGLLASFKSIKRIVLHEQSKRAKLTAVFQGWYDGIRGIMGKRRSANSAADKSRSDPC